MKNLKINAPAGMPKYNMWVNDANGFKTRCEFKRQNDMWHFPAEVFRRASYRTQAYGGEIVDVVQKKQLHGKSEQIVKISEGSKPAHKVITQKLYPVDGQKPSSVVAGYGGRYNEFAYVDYGVIKPGTDRVKTTVISSPTDAFKDHKLIQMQRADGYYSSARTVGKDVVGGYEVIPVQRKFLQGFKGKMQKLAMMIGQDTNGCERPVLRKVAGFIFKNIK